MYTARRILLNAGSPHGGGGGAPGAGGGAGGGAGTGAGAGGGGGGQSQPYNRPGYREIPDADYTKFDADSKYAQAFRGYGFSDPKEFEPFAPVIKRVRELKADPRLLLGPLGDDSYIKELQKQAGGEPKQFDPEAFKAELRQEQQLADAERSHNDEVKKADSLVEAAFTQIWGKDKPDEVLGPMLKDAAQHRLHQLRIKASYPDGHPLAGRRLPPISQQMVEQVFKEVGEQLKKIKAGRLTGIGQAANAGGAGTTPAGQQGGSGEPAQQPDEPFHRKSRADKIKYVESRRQGTGASV
jgi:hypothetical protein